MWRSVGQGTAVQVGCLVRAEELAGGDEQRSAGARQDVGGLARGVAGVERDDDAAGVVGGKACDDPVPGVRRPDRDTVAGRHAEVDHRGGGRADLVAQLRVGQPPVVGHHGVVVGELVGNPVQDLRNGPRIGLSSMLL